MMNISKVSTTVRDELNIMDMFDEDFTMWGDQNDLDKDEYSLEMFNYRREMEAKGYVLNPHYDEDLSRWKEKHNDRAYDKYLDFDCNEFVTPEELQWYEDMRHVVMFGYTLCDRLMTDEEMNEFDRLMWAGEVA